MEAVKTIIGQNEEEIWRKIENDFEQDPDLLQYQAEIEQDGRTVLLDVDIDLGGGFEGGFELTTFSAPLQETSLHFNLHKEGFWDGVGKAFGMQDEILGYEEFDDKVIVKTDDFVTLRSVLSNPQTRQLFLSLDNYRFYTEEDGSVVNLVLEIESGITNPIRLREIYRAFWDVLHRL